MTSLPTLADIEAERERRATSRDQFAAFIRATFRGYRPKPFLLRKYGQHGPVIDVTPENK